MSRAPLPQIEKFKARMGWHFKWVSSFGNDFNFDYHVSATPEEKASGKAMYNYEMTTFPSEERPGASVFYKNQNGEIFHTYSSYGRGLDMLIGSLSHARPGTEGPRRGRLGLADGLGAPPRPL